MSLMPGVTGSARDVGVEWSYLGRWIQLELRAVDLFEISQALNDDQEESD